MPDDAKKGSVSKIPMGFGLSGYDFMKKQETQTSNLPNMSALMNGMMNAVWEGGLIDDRWVSEDKYKQVQVQVANYQSCPLAYKENNELCYGELVDNVDQWSKTGAGAYTNSGRCPKGNGEGLCGAILEAPDINKRDEDGFSAKLKRWAYHLDCAIPGRTDFFIPIAFPAQTIADYLGHFYGIATSYKRVCPLLNKRLICLEVVFNMGNTAKAVRVKITDSPGPDNAGTKGSHNKKYPNAVYDYDDFEISHALLATKYFEEFVAWDAQTASGKKWGMLNAKNGSEFSGIYFPWYEAAYNYKDASIKGYGPKGIVDLKLTYKDTTGRISPKSSIRWKIQGRTPTNGWPIARVRIYAEPEDADAVRRIIPSIPDEFFKTNFSNSGDAVWVTGGGDLSNYDSVNSRIVSAANMVAEYITRKGNLTYDGDFNNPKFVLSGSGGQNNIPKYDSGNNIINCDGFVHWVLLEAGLTTDLIELMKISARDWTANHVQKYLLSGFKAVDLKTDIEHAVPGDILVFSRGKYSNGDDVHHCAILSEKTSAKTYKEYGMGGSKHCKSGAPISHDAMNFTHIGCIIRIVEEKKEESTS